MHLDEVAAIREEIAIGGFSRCPMSPGRVPEARAALPL